MVKTKKKLTRDEKLAKDRERKKLKYAEMKSNPELYRIFQEKEKQRYLLKKERKKVVGIKDMSERAKREQRRRWRKNSLSYLKKIKEQKKLNQILLENSPPESENEDIQEPRIIQDDPLATTSNSQPVQKAEPVDKNSTSKNKNDEKLNKTIRRIRYNHLKVLKELKNNVNILIKENENLRRNLNRQKIQKSKEDTLEKKVDNMIKDIRQDKIREVKRKLLFSETITRGFCEKYKETAKKDKRSLAESVLTSKEKLLKYRIVSKLPFSLKKKQAERDQGKKEAQMKLQVQHFFEEDVNSQVAAGKKECIKRNGIRKQKRYLTDNLKNLHVKYCKQVGFIGYSTFCRYRPFWTVHPGNKRDTCQCKLHANTNLLAESLHKARIIKESSVTDILSSLCCNMENSTCLQRSCERCNRNVLHYNEFDNSKNVTYYEWILEKQSYTGKDGKSRFKNVTTKKKKEDRPCNIIKKLDSVLKTLFKHCLTISVQYTEITKLKENLTNKEIVCHIDFSENYCLKYHEEIQSFHFGASRGQVCLHTGVLYYLDQQKSVTTKAFCTMSQCLNHDASAIWAHITPILDLAHNLVPNLNSIHFVSDSPSSQYRNRYVFHMLTKLKDQISCLQEVTWSYLEAGHGKGAPDGVGAVVKRTADNYVKYGGDVGSFEEFVQIVQQNVHKVELIIIPQEEVLKKRFSTHIPGFKGTTKVHQVVWSSDLPYSVAFRTLSCFMCRGSFLPCEHNKHLGVLSTGFGDMATTRMNASGVTKDTNDLENIDVAQETTTKVDETYPQPFLSSPIAHYSCQDDLGRKGNIEVEFGLEIPQLNTSGFPDLGIYNDFGSPINRLDKQTNNLSDFRVEHYVETGTPPQIDTPTLYNNLRNIIVKSTLNESTHEADLFDSAQGSGNVNIISNVPYTYQRFSARNHAIGFSSIDQTEFEKFLKSSPNIIDPEFEQQLSTPTDTDYDLKYDVDMWVIVEYKLKKTSQFYIGKIIKTCSNTKEYTMIFVRKVRGGLFGWPVISDEDTVSESQIVQRLEDPQENRRGQLSFDKLPKLNFK